MKVVLYMLILISFSGCFLGSKKGNGDVTIENRPVTSFNKIETKGVFNVILKQADTENVKVETDDNLQELIVVQVENGTLTLGMRQNSNFRNSTKMNIYVSFKQINSIKNSLVGNLSSDGLLQLPSLLYTSSAVGNTKLELETGQLDMDISAVGNTVMKGKASDCIFKNTGVGNFDGEDLIVENMQLNNSAVGNTIINAKNLDLKNKAVGKTTNKNVAAGVLEKVGE